MADFSNIPTGLKINSQIPLDIKGYVLNKATLAYLGVDDNLAFTYHEGLRVICIEEKELYEWREVQLGEENTGLIPTDFTYPSDLPEIYGINYSDRTFNFFEIVVSNGLSAYDIWLAEGNVGTEEDFLNSLVGPQGPAGDGSNLFFSSGTTTTLIGNGSELNPYTTEVKNLQKEISSFPYTLTSLDDKHTIFVNNGISNVTINVPDNLVDNFACVFIQEGTGTVSFLGTGTSILNKPTGYETQILDEKWWVLLEKKLNTSNYYLGGNLLPSV